MIHRAGDYVYQQLAGDVVQIGYCPLAARKPPALVDVVPELSAVTAAIWRLTGGKRAAVVGEWMWTDEGYKNLPNTGAPLDGRGGS